VAALLRQPRATLAAFETGRSVPLLTTVEKLVQAIDDAGVEMIDQNQLSQARGVGVRLKS
jgi:predicted transcriptional regulator